MRTGIAECKGDRGDGSQTVYLPRIQCLCELQSTIEVLTTRRALLSKTIKFINLTHHCSVTTSHPYLGIEFVFLLFNQKLFKNQKFPGNGSKYFFQKPTKPEEGKYQQYTVKMYSPLVNTLQNIKMAFQGGLMLFFT